LSSLFLQIAREVSSPLAKTNEIVLLGGANGDLLKGIANTTAQLPPAIQALTGVDISQIFAKIPGARTK
jgi:flotillin